MNLQRWIALGMLAVVIACAATSNLWMARFQDDDEQTPTPDATGTASVLSEGTSEIDIEVSGTVTPTLNPAVAAIMEEIGMTGATSNQPFVVYAGDFTSIDQMYQGVGVASIYQVGDNRFVLRLDPISVTTGPDLHVLLAKLPAPRTSTEATAGSLDLGALASPTAAQNFEIPEGTDLGPYKSVVIYSRSLNIVYSTAELTEIRGTSR
jgi:hypothetical protein